uniref:NAD-dependent glycerol-3-phosphate dehydrogenase n=1 Tax=Megaviridae environmental sample TaxID=1737588 RepID=A0A5J6VJU4_9VIRU|nr:MAG: NAD-dependent glycerol-3-phosphate dehydrogenase [Megaviridae environmental sample]
MKIAILGTGSMALAMCKLFEKILDSITVYGRDEQQLFDLQNNSSNSKYFKYKFNLKFICNYLDNFNIKNESKYDIIFYCLPVKCLSSFYYNPNCNIIYLCKGFKENYLYNQTKNHGILLGPSYADEIIEGAFTYFTFSSNNEKLLNLTKILFSKIKQCKIFYSDSIKEIELFGIYKNIISVVCGILDTLEFPRNTVAAFIVRILWSTGIECKDLRHPAGIGDIFLTCSSNKSRNYQFGMYLIKNNRINYDILSEGFNSIKHIKNNAIITQLNFFINNINTMNLEEKKTFLLDLIKN